MNPQLAPNAAKQLAPEGPLPDDAWEPRRQRIQAYVDAQRTRLAAIQRELNEHVARLGLHGESPAAAAGAEAELQSHLDQSRAECERLRGRLAETEGELPRLRQDLESLRSQWEGLAAENAQLHEQLLQRQAVPSSDDLPLSEAQSDTAQLQQEYQDLQRRYEMALDDLKSERAEIAQLECKLQKAAAGSPPAAGEALASDWESQKRRLLASLESDFDENDAEDRRDRLSIEEAVRRTDEALAAKGREIEELQRLLEEQSSNIGSMAVGAAAIAEVLDRDEIIRLERENLQALQDEWREKLRHAEVEISVQRAKLARHQAELEERARQLDQQARHDPPDENGDRQDKPTRGRWLRRLGLGGGDEE